MSSTEAVPGPGRACPACGSRDTIPCLRKESMCLVRCGRCGMVLQDPLQVEFAVGDYYEGQGAQYYLSPDKLRSDHSPVRYERELRLLRSHVPSGRILDVGCGTGGFLHQLRLRHGDAYAGVGNDIAGPAVDHAEALGIRVHRGPLSALSADPPFDVVTFWAVLEHLPDPGGFLDEAHRLLRPGGTCIALVPNFRSLAVRLAGPRYRYILPQHVNYFDVTTLSGLFTRRPGFEVVARHGTHFNPVVIAQDLRRPRGFVPDSQRGRLLARTNALKANPLLAPLHAVYRGMEALLGAAGLTDNVVVVARRR